MPTYYIGSMPIDDGDIKHYGRKGMKWGKNIYGDDDYVRSSERLGRIGNSADRAIGLRTRTAQGRAISGFRQGVSKTLTGANRAQASSSASKRVGGEMDRLAGKRSTYSGKTGKIRSFGGTYNNYKRPQTNPRTGAYEYPTYTRREYYRQTPGSDSAFGGPKMAPNTQTIENRKNAAVEDGKKPKKKQWYESGWEATKSTANWVGGKMNEGANWAGKKVGEGADWAGKKATEGWNWVKKQKWW